MLKETGEEIRSTNTPAEGTPCLKSCKGAKQVGFTVVEGLSFNKKDRSLRSCQPVQSASGSAPFRDQPVTSCATAGIDLWDCVFDGESICTVIATAGVRYANVTHTHIRAPAHSWSSRGSRLNR